ncbi:MAG: beta-propeller fold lactonase family protein [Solirubrobacteraceae bacterium]|nr:beta-propeller fold lactonase family protein [Solirubrobacteraceae bacterium]
MRSFRRLLLAILAAFVALFLFLASCGDDAADRPAKATTPALPFPPTAFEPATSRGGGPTPEGRVVRIGGRPEGVAIDPATGTLAVALGADGTELGLFDAQSLQLRSKVRLPAGARHVSFGAGRFLVPMEDADQLAQVAPSGGEAELTDVGDGPHDATAADGQLFVGDEFGGTVSVLRDGKLRTTMPVDVQPGGIVDVGDGKVAIISVRAYTVELLDTQTLRTSGSQNAGYGPSHAVATTDGRVLVADTRGGAVLVYETRPRLKFIQRLATGGSPYGLAIDQRRNRLWVTDSGADRVLEVDTAGELREVAEYPTVRQPNSVAVDERSGAAVVVGQAGGELQRIGD